MGAQRKRWERLIYVAMPLLIFLANLVLSLHLNHRWQAYFWTLMASMVLASDLIQRDCRCRHQRRDGA